MALATVADVTVALSRALTAAEQSKSDPRLLEEASDLVIGECGCDPTDVTDPDNPVVPDPVVRVVARMVARVLEQDADGAPPTNVDESSHAVGPFSGTTKYTPGSTTGSPWLTKADKIRLAPFNCNAKAFAVDTAPDVTYYDGPWGPRVAEWWDTV